MPNLRKYNDLNAYYVRARHNRVFSTFQLSVEAYNYLQSNNLLFNGCEIGWNVFHNLHNRGWIYTGGSGHEPDTAGRIIPIPPPPELSVQHLWFLNQTGLSLLVRNVSVKNLHYSGPAVLSVNKIKHTGQVRQHRFDGLPAKGISLWNLLPDDASVDVELLDAEGNHLAETELDLLEEDVMLFKSGRACREDLIEVAPEEILMGFPKGVCLLSSDDVLPLVKGGVFEETKTRWKGFRLQQLRPASVAAPRITVTAGKRRWQLEVCSPLELRSQAPLIFSKGRIEFTGSQNLHPVAHDDPMNVQIVYWNDSSDFLAVLDDSRLLIETEAECWLSDVRDIRRYFSNEASEHRQFSLRAFCIGENIPLSDGLVSARLEGSRCREDITISFFRIPDEVETPSCRVGEHVYLTLGDTGTTFKSNSPLSLADAEEKKRVIARFQYSEYDSLDISWFPTVEDAVLVVDGELIHNGSSLDLALLKKSPEIAFLPPDDRTWSVRAGDNVLTHPGKTRLPLKSSIRSDLETEPKALPITASLGDKTVSTWSLSTTPSLLRIESEWEASNNVHEYLLTIRLSWFGFAEPSLQVVLIADERIILDSNPVVTPRNTQPVDHKSATQFLVSHSLVSLLHRAGELRIEVVLDKVILSRTKVEPFPFLPPPRDPDQLLGDIRRLLATVREGMKDKDACFEQIFFLSEEYTSVAKAMPFDVDAMCQRLDMSTTSTAVSIGLRVLEALVAQREVMAAIPPTPEVEGMLRLHIQSLRVFYEAFLFSRGHGFPDRLSGLTAELKSLSTFFDNERVRAWATAVAAYGDEITAKRVIQKSAAIKGACTLASKSPIITCYEPFLDWLRRAK